MCTGLIPRPLFDAITMTYRYEWRALSYVIFFQQDYPPFDFTPPSHDDGQHPHGHTGHRLSGRAEPVEPLYKWFLAIPHFAVCLALAIASVVTVLWGALTVIVTGTYPLRAQWFIIGAFRYRLRVETYVGALTDQYPPFHLTA